jgi:mercuric ion transport protein
MQDRSSVSLVAATFAAVGASACCVGPLLLVTAGLGGAWLGALHALYPYRWAFIGIALSALGFAGWQIFRSAQMCEPGQACADPAVVRRRKALFGIVTGLVALGAASPYLVAYLA